MNIFKRRGGSTDPGVSPADKDLARARKDLESSQADLQRTREQTPLHRAVIAAAAREVFEVNHLAQLFHQTLRKRP